ncbi:MAG: DUF4187 domain-containing protein [Planctomycetota bacterium]|jgi:hypothetical protein
MREKMIIRRNGLWFSGTILFSAVMLVVFLSLTIKAKQSNETNYVMKPKEILPAKEILTVKEFIKLADSHRIQRIEVYYSFWCSTQYPSSEVTFRNKWFDSKSIINNPHPKELSPIKQELEKFTPDQDPVYIRFPDYRLGFVAQDDSGRELTISFVYNMPVMSVNGKLYRTSPELVTSVIDFLPHKSYDRINKELVYIWYGRGLKNVPDKKER